jgi:bifunctional non-homologous end joining protein LigD
MSKSKKIESLIKSGARSEMPVIKPMLCTLVKKPFDDPEYLYEIKLDGYRIIAYVKKGKVILRTRGGLDYTHKYKSVAKKLEKFEDVVLDGEMVVLNEEGKPDFNALQKNTGEKPLAYYAFDILWIRGYNLIDLPLSERKEILSSITFNDTIKRSHVFKKGIELFELVREHDLEGIVAKKKNSKYQPGKRSKDWLKVPTEQRQEFVIGGWTESSSATPFASLLFGYYEKGKLIYQGHAGSGYKEKQKTEIIERLKKIEIKKSPFSNKVDSNRKAHYVKPQLVASIKFASYTKSGKIRKPAIFIGLQEKKS